MISVRLILKLLPWVLLLLATIWIAISQGLGINRITGGKELNQNTLLTQVEQLGKLELAKYNFQEVTEVTKIADVVDLKLFKYKVAPDSKAILISQGSATGCIDLTQITEEDISEVGDSLYITLPAPELCYFKIDLENSRLYDLQINYLPVDQRAQFIQELYQAAEQEIKNSALQTGILEQTEINAKLILKPLFESITNKTVLFNMSLASPIPSETLESP